MLEDGRRRAGLRGPPRPRSGRGPGEGARAAPEPQPLLAHDPDVEGLIRREREEASGVVALDGSRVVGYLLGRHASGPIGQHVWSTWAGHAADDPDLVFELGSDDGCAPGGSMQGCRGTSCSRPQCASESSPGSGWASEPGSFQAARTVDEPNPFSAPDVAVRLSTPADLSDVAALAREQASHLRTSPSFSELAVESPEATMEEWRDTWVKTEYTHFVAERAGQVVGHLLLFQRPSGDLRVPPGAWTSRARRRPRRSEVSGSAVRSRAPRSSGPATTTRR